jgi:predicted Zn-dependent protease
MGFLAKVQSEAELGFVLTHEIGHFEEQHALNNVI